MNKKSIEEALHQLRSAREETTSQLNDVVYAINEIRGELMRLAKVEAVLVQLLKETP